MGDSSFAEHSATQGDSGTSMPMRVAGGVHLINGADRPQSVVFCRLDPPAADHAGLHGGGRRTRLGCNTGGRQLIAKPLGGLREHEATMRARAVDASAVVKLTVLINASWLPRAIQVAAALRIGEILADGPLGIGEIARRSESNPEALGRVLRVLSAQAIVEEIDENVFGPTVLSDHLRYIDHAGSGEESWSTWGGLLDAVRSGRPACEEVHGSGFFERVALDAERERNWNDWNTITARAWLPPVIDALELRGHETVVDIGGGQGNFLAELLPRFPGCNGVLLDLPSVVAGAGEVFARSGVAERCRIVPGDAFEKVPSNADVYLFCRVLFNWDRARRVALLRRCRAAARSDSRLMIIEMMMPERGDPARGFRAAADLNLWVSWGGTIPTRTEWDAMLRDAGFEIRRASEPVSPVFAWQVIEAAPT